MSESLFEQAFTEIQSTVEKEDSLPESFSRWQVMDRLSQPDRVIRFTVRWMDDQGRVQNTPAWRVQYCNVLGPYKGGLRFTPDVCEDTLLFLAFEQCFKNALTGLPLGGGKGGAQFKTSDHSESEVLRFCQSFMDEFVRYGGEDTDVPAGDIGTGPREIGWLFGRYAKLTGSHVGTLTGKPEALGGLPGRIEATGYGAVHFARLVMQEQGKDLDGLRIAISGAGNVALHAAERAIDYGAKVLSLSNSKGLLRFDEKGLTSEQLEELKSASEGGRRLEELASDTSWMKLDEDGSPWNLECDVAMPCATQNELQDKHAKMLAKQGAVAVVEGANMPCTADATETLCAAGVLVVPGKAANAGGVGVSGFEMIQNATRDPWSREKVITRLDELMEDIHSQCVEKGQTEQGIDYIKGANLAGYERLARAIVAAGPN